MPAVRFETLRRIVAEREIGVAFNRDVVVVVEANQLSQLQVSRVRRGFVRYPFHHVAITRNEIRVVVDELVSFLIEDRSELCLCDCHPYRVSYALTERACRRFNTGCVPVLRMTRCAALPLAELLEIVER